LSLFGDRVEFFLAQSKQQKRDFNYRDLSVANDEENKKKIEILNRWKKREQKKLLSDFVPLHCEK
jgi:hypothetical protein